MRILVIAENSDEVPVADRVVNTFPRTIPSILSTIAHSLNTHPVSYSARAMQWRELFNGVQLEPEVRAYIEALERSVFCGEAQ